VAAGASQPTVIYTQDFDLILYDSAIGPKLPASRTVIKNFQRNSADVGVHVMFLSIWSLGGVIPTWELRSSWKAKNLAQERIDGILVDRKRRDREPSIGIHHDTRANGSLSTQLHAVSSKT
jgi:hypothetical protein